MKIRMVALGLMLASGMAVAQAPAPHGSPNASDKHPGMRMQDELGLTEEQVAKMRAIRDGGGTREEMQAVLTPEQRVKAAQLKQANKGDRAQRKARMQEQLGITDEQMEKMNEIKRNGGTREEMRAVLTPEQQAKFDGLRSKRSVHAPAPKPAATPATPAAPATSGKPATPATPATPAAPATPASTPKP